MNFETSAFFSFVLTLGLFACAQVPSAAKTQATLDSDNHEPAPMSREPFDGTSACIDAWHEMLSEWKENGGGMKRSLVDMRRHIAEDKKSRFAAMVRATWKEQRLNGKFSSQAFGAWPIPRSEGIDVGLAHSAIEDASYGMPKECFSTVWLAPMLWSEVVIMEDRSVGVRPAEAPSNLPWSSPYANYWTMHWLLRYVP